MNKELKDEWVAALRSGDYEQGKNHLRSIDNKFCCLGVLCDLIVKKNPDYIWTPSKNYYWLEQEENILPDSIMKIAEMQDNAGSYNIEKTPLWELNDLEDKSFSEIADVIEENWEKL